MQLPISRHEGNGRHHLNPDVPMRVIIAFDGLTSDEKRSVTEALGEIEHVGLNAQSLSLERLGGNDPFYAVRPAPNVVVLLLAEPGTPVKVWDIARPAMLDSFAHAR